MQNGVIIILIGVILILLGMLYAGNDFSFFIASEETEVTTETERLEGAPTENKGREGANKTPINAPPSSQTNFPGVHSESIEESSLQSGVVIVTYTSDGFVPPVIEVRAGEQVHFINRSNKGLWVTADLHPTAKEQSYPEFDQGRTISNGGTYTFVFTKVGVWGYKNLNDGNHLGTVSVIQQN